MERYTLTITPQFLIAASGLVERMAQYDKNHAIKFRDAVTHELELLHTLPFASKSLRGGRRGRIVDNHILTFNVLEDEKKVVVIDIFNPTQHSKAQRYL